MSLVFNWVDRMRLFWKILTRLHGTNLCIISTISASLHRLSCSNKTIQNAPKHYEMHQIMNLGSNGVDRVRSMRKISDATSEHKLVNYLHQFNLFCTEFRVVTKHCQVHSTLQNAPKHEFRVQWGGSGAFVVKNFEAISWHELVH